MKWFINELSLDGQYRYLDDFLEDGNDFLRVLKLAKQIGGTIEKHSSLYQRKITETETLYGLSGIRGNDQVTALKSMLLRLSSSPPFWDIPAKPDGTEFWLGDDIPVTDTSVSKAAQEQGSLLSFQHDAFTDRMLSVHSEEKTYEVASASTAGYMAKKMFAAKQLCRFDYLKAKFAGTRVDVAQLEPAYGCDSLETSEFEDVVQALCRIIAYPSWKEVLEDTSLVYKAYTPSSKKVDWFSHGSYGDKRMDKFRAGNSRPLRCFGYREQETFVLLRIERDHTVSDRG